MDRLNDFSYLQTGDIIDAAESNQTPFYLYDERTIKDRCAKAMSMPNAFGITVRYAMKANSTKAIMQIISKQGVHFDASSLSEVKRAAYAGVPLDHILLTTQEVPLGEERGDLEEMMLGGLLYNVCSMRQMELVSDFAAKNSIPLSIRLHPGVGAGESASRNTGDDYSCFGVHLVDLERLLNYAGDKGIVFDRVHTHIGSGGDPALWRNNIDIELGLIEKYFPKAQVINLGGGLKESRMPDESSADINQLGQYAKKQIEAFYERTGRKLKMEIEPGTFIMANSGYIVTSVLDKKITGSKGFPFVILDGGMEVNARPAMYGSRHPLYVIGGDGQLKSSDFQPKIEGDYSAVVVGRCCESGDSQTLDIQGNILLRPMAEPEMGDFVVIGGAGAYCSAMAPFNYNSHEQAAEVLLTEGGELVTIRFRQTLEQMTVNEISFL